MGDKYQFMKECPNCGNKLWCYYAESCGHTSAKCPNCGKEFDIILDFTLKEKP